MLSLHTCFLAKVISTNGGTAKIQPLGKTKEYGKNAVSQSPLTDVPIANSAKYKYTKETITYVVDAHSNTKASKDIVTVVPLEAGDIVICVCGERNISDAKKGIDNTPPVGHHSMSDSIIIGIL